MTEHNANKHFKHDPQSHSTEDTCLLLTDKTLPLFCLHSNSSIIWLCTRLTYFPRSLSSIFKVNLFKLRLDCGHLPLHELICVKEERKKGRKEEGQKHSLWESWYYVHSGSVNGNLHSSHGWPRNYSILPVRQSRKYREQLKHTHTLLLTTLYIIKGEWAEF